MMHTLAPSRPETHPALWHGKRDGDGPLTVQQRAALAREKRHMNINVDIMALGEVHTCPLVAQTRDGWRSLVITPCGEKHWFDRALLRQAQA